VNPYNTVKTDAEYREIEEINAGEKEKLG